MLTETANFPPPAADTQTLSQVLYQLSASQRKVLFTLNIGDYQPKIREITYPLFKHWARKIGAEFSEIKTRRFPAWPVAYEKLQIHSLAREVGEGWFFFFDADTLIHPDFWDPTDHLQKDTVAHNGRDMAGHRWRYDQYLRRDGRHIGSCNWCAIASDWCLDLWRPSDLTLEESLENIFPTTGELKGFIDKAHLIDDYTLSRNIARFGLKFTTLVDIGKRLGYEGGNPFLWHKYNMPEEQKIAEMRGVLKTWGVE